MPDIMPRFIIVTLIFVNFAILFAALARHEAPGALRANAASPSSFCVDGQSGKCTSWL
jgi:hypothetical protein